MAGENGVEFLHPTRESAGSQNPEHHRHMNIDEGGKSMRAQKESLTHSPSLIKHFNTENLGFDPCINRASIRRPSLYHRLSIVWKSHCCFRFNLILVGALGREVTIHITLKTHYLLLKHRDDHSFPMIN